jgi:hypothetical protein
MEKGRSQQEELPLVRATGKIIVNAQNSDSRQAGVEILLLDSVRPIGIGMSGRERPTETGIEGTVKEKEIATMSGNEIGTAEKEENVSVTGITRESEKEIEIAIGGTETETGIAMSPEARNGADEMP